MLKTKRSSIKLTIQLNILALDPTAFIGAVNHFIELRSKTFVNEKKEEKKKKRAKTVCRKTTLIVFVYSTWAPWGFCVHDNHGHDNFES